MTTATAIDFHSTLRNGGVVICASALMAASSIVDLRLAEVASAARKHKGAPRDDLMLRSASETSASRRMASGTAAPAAVLRDGAPQPGVRRLRLLWRLLRTRSVIVEAEESACRSARRDAAAHPPHGYFRTFNLNFRNERSRRRRKRFERFLKRIFAFRHLRGRNRQVGPVHLAVVEAAFDRRLDDGEVGRDVEVARRVER